MKVFRILTPLIAAVMLIGCSSGGSGGGASTPPAPAPAPSAPPASSSLYPDYNTNPIAPDATGMNATAAEIAADFELGFNIGNTLEATGGETGWGNPKITNEFVAAIKANGFDAVRLPVSWNQYADQNTAEIDGAWLDRVKDVVQYCIDNDLYVIVNIHWDSGWLEDNVSPEKQDEVNAKQKAFWEQIATHLRDFDQRLMFASANEPAVETAVQMDVLTSYHQTFVDAVRSTGGKNAYRVLILQGPATDIEKTDDLWWVTPTDTATERLMMEVHFYTPWQFAGLTEDASWGNRFFYWGSGNHSSTDTDHNPTWGEEATVDDMFGLMKTKFIDEGIPVILGEYGAIRRTHLTGADLDLHLASRAYYLKYVTQQALANGLVPFYWDEGSMGNHGFGIFDRSDNTVFDTQAHDAILEGAGK